MKVENHHKGLQAKIQGYFCSDNVSYFRTQGGCTQSVVHLRFLWLSETEKRKKVHTWMLCLPCTFFPLCLPLGVKCHWKYRHAQSAVLIPLSCPSHAHSMHPDPTHSLFFHTHPPAPTHSFALLLQIDGPQALPSKEKSLRQRDSRLEGCAQRDLGVCKGHRGLCSIWGFISATAGLDNEATRRATETQAVAAKLLHW